MESPVASERMILTCQEEDMFRPKLTAEYGHNLERTPIEPLHNGKRFIVFTVPWVK